MRTETRDKMQAVLDRAVEEGELAGGNLLVVKDGRQECYLEAGMADIAAAQPIRRDSLFRLYSMSKPITAAAAMKLMEEGLLDLGTPVSAYFPTYHNPMVDEGGVLVPSDREITVKDLLDMTSGLTYNGTPGLAGVHADVVWDEIDQRLFSGNPVTTLEFAEKMGASPLYFKPGEGWLYGSSADVLGAVIEKVSGMRFGEYLGKYFFAPLKMHDTAFYVPKDKRNRLTKVYESDGEGGFRLFTGNHLGIVNMMEESPAFESGGAGLVSTVDDYARFGQMLIGGGELDGVRVLQPETVRFMTAGSLNPVQQADFTARQGNMPGFTYGNLMRVMERPGGANFACHRGDYGWDGWLGCCFINDPTDKTSIVFMMQRTDAGLLPVIRKMRNVMLYFG